MTDRPIQMTIYFYEPKDGIVKVRAFCKTSFGRVFVDSECSVELPIHALLQIMQADAEAWADLNKDEVIESKHVPQETTGND